MPHDLQRKRVDSVVPTQNTDADPSLSTSFASWLTGLGSRVAIGGRRLENNKLVLLRKRGIVKDIILMWSHYCKSHSGFCVEFDISKLSACGTTADKINWVEVKYVKEVPEFSIFSNPTFDQYVKHKFESWSYEEEVRAFRLPSNYRFSPDCITGVTFGLNAMNQKLGTAGHQNMVAIKSLIDSRLPHIKNFLTLAKKNKDSFKIDLQKIDFQFLD